ncbi:TspO and MBR related proteins [Monaibacterium marinum]|uniref:TspO and MBR related proteins n=1 Tax=Pontivivens marinum TaxID=1690039 RepID=A0A2C9CPN8_9RHOB|nr:tryptophan-rich sensory protein [Monaibacterium marinum]SOH93481.1 TspO and MBR related proteins [Monaibacterium marinum]
MRYLNLILAILFAAMPFFTPFNGFSPDRYPIPQGNPAIQPAGWAFSIWGLIYLGLILHTGREAIVQKVKPDLMLTLSLSIGVIWLPVAGYSPVWATILILIMLFGAVCAMLNRAQPLATVPLGLYAGWLSAASFVSIALLAAGYGIAFDDLGWARVLLPVAVLFAAAIQWRAGFAPAYSVAVIWALIGIIAQARTVHVDVAIIAGLGITTLIGVLLATYRRKIA